MDSSSYSRKRRLTNDSTLVVCRFKLTMGSGAGRFLSMMGKWRQEHGIWLLGMYRHEPRYDSAYIGRT
jgi:hypothetical protein